MDNWNKPFLRGLFSEEDGTPSFSRMAAGMSVAFACGWVTAIVLNKHALPDFAGLSLFVTALYGARKLAGVFDKPGDPKP